MAEMRLLHLKNELVKKGFDMNGKLRKINYHEISADYVLDDINLTSRINFSPEFLNLLRQRGRAEAEKWLKNDADAVGIESSINLAHKF